MSSNRKLRIGFIHPDLGIGGAERLVVDAAVSLQRLGHDVTMFTSRHDLSRCFEETRDGTLTVHVLGSSLPRSLHPRLPLTIVFSILRSLLLAVLLLLSLLLPGPPTPLNPLSPIEKFDIFFVDQQSVAVPLLRFVSGTRVVFYCHFPDKLLSGGWDIDITQNQQYGSGQDTVQRKSGSGGAGLLKKLYRWPVDKLEEYTTGQADIVLSNSQFTSKVYAKAFPSLAKRPPRVVYPCIDVDAYQPASKRESNVNSSADDTSIKLIASGRPTVLSFNRFEAKKNAALAIRSFARLKTESLVSETDFTNLRLVLGGGYDAEESDNVRTLSELQRLCDESGLSHQTIGSSPSSPPDKVQVLFILNFSNAQRTHLLTSPHTRCLLYTPANEHFGIVPVEAMSCGVPVLAADSGGPTETIIDISSDKEGGTGILRPPTAEAWAPALASLLNQTATERATISKAAKTRVREKFSLDTLGRMLEEACRDALALGDLHMQLGDKLIWGGASLMAFAAMGLATVLFFSR